MIVKKIKGSKFLLLKPELEDKSPYEIFSLLQNEFGALEIANVPQFEPELLVVPKTDTLTRARSRDRVYDPISLEKEFDYFMTPKQKQDPPMIQVSEPESIENRRIVENSSDHEAFVGNQGFKFQMLLMIVSFHSLVSTPKFQDKNLLLYFSFRKDSIHRLTSIQYG